jgi:tRNA threonylcarbamoyladenosine modification (KEOPS) complex  Pcc1 subunit
MTPSTPRWTATVRVATGKVELARWLARALAPEAAREVPRARTVLRQIGASVELRVEALDAGAMRAALNTFLGWVALSLATAQAADAARTPAEPAAEAVISRSR